MVDNWCQLLWSLAVAFPLGAVLALTGTTLQSALRNPLAEPYTLGMVGGGTLFAASALVLPGLWAAPSGFWHSVAASVALHTRGVFHIAGFLGALFALALVGLVAWGVRCSRRRSGSDAQMRSSFSTVLVAGFVVGGFLGSLDMLVLSYAKPEDFAEINRWLWGASLAQVGFPHFVIVSILCIVSLAVLYAVRRELNVMELGHDEAECLGVNTRAVLILAVGTVALATSVAVSLAGAVGFIGLVVPHFVRRVCGPKMQRQLPSSALAGGVTLVVAQFLAGLMPGQLGVGVVCAIFMAPFFLVLLGVGFNTEGRDV